MRKKLLSHPYLVKLSKLLTIVYLIGAFFVTAATSKQGDSKNDVRDTYVTNFAVTSNCENSIGHAGIRVQNNVIIELQIPGSSSYKRQRSFKELGFPKDQAAMGAEVRNDELKQTCVVMRSSQYSYPDYDKNQTEYWFANPGNLTTKVYSCYTNDAHTCDIVVEELPVGELSTVYR